MQNNWAIIDVGRFEA